MLSNAFCAELCCFAPKRGLCVTKDWNMLQLATFFLLWDRSGQWVLATSSEIASGIILTSENVAIKRIPKNMASRNAETTCKKWSSYKIYKGLLSFLSFEDATVVSCFNLGGTIQEESEGKPKEF